MKPKSRQSSQANVCVVCVTLSSRSCKGQSISQVSDQFVFQKQYVTKQHYNILIYFTSCRLW